MSHTKLNDTKVDYTALAQQIKIWAQELGFAQAGITDIDLSDYKQGFSDWLANNYHGDMDYMARHGLMRAHPEQLLEGTLRVISVRMNYLPQQAKFAHTLKRSEQAYISRYAVGRDYHKLVRKRLKQLGEKISQYCEHLNFRPFVDSAPILERPLAEKANLGWIGKHSLVINKEAGSWFFLGELLVNIPLPCDPPHENTQQTTKGTSTDCGKCVACIKICPTQAIVAPYVVDARRCLSYLTIEHQGSIPIEFRQAMGNRIYGCDDCQLICPWNKFAPQSSEGDFQMRQQFAEVSLLTLFSWSEDSFLKQTEGSAIRRIGYQSWQRNIAIALGNITSINKSQCQEIIDQLEDKLVTSTELVAEHIHWALQQQRNNLAQLPDEQISTLDNQVKPAHNSENRLTARLIRSIEKGLARDA